MIYYDLLLLFIHNDWKNHAIATIIDTKEEEVVFVLINKIAS